MAPLSLTLKGQIEARHISEGCNLEPLADTAKFIINDRPNSLLMIDRKSYMVAFGGICFDLE